MRAQADGARLDRALADWRGLSRAAVLRLLDQGAVTRNGSAVGPGNKGDLLRAGDTLGLDAAYAQGETPLADPGIALDVLDERAGWLIINKPAGMPVRPHALGETGTVINAVVARCPQAVGVGEGGLRSGVVHRLDTDTSGVLLVATRQDAWERFRGAFAEHRIRKQYLALVHGVPDTRGVFRRDLRVATHRPARVVVEPEGRGGSGSRTCSLGWRVLERFDERASLIEVDLHTGFLHQVRAMMSHLGHPVVGDDVYGDQANALSATRQMLHARSLTYEEIGVQAPIPADMGEQIEALQA